ncbi:MAG: SpoIID/LytB domain-containing protein [Bdellovibrionales bacterium]|nr:SpoIID/LytB domain-containing protein [Bdellovibrionales bacterium]
MKERILSFRNVILTSSLFVVATLLVGFSARASELVRVRLKRAASAVEIQAMDLRVSSLPFSGSVRPAAMGSMRFESIVVRVQRAAQGLPLWKIRRRDSGVTETTRALPLEIKGEVMRLGLEPVPRHLKLFPREDGSIDVVTEMDVESYLSGVVPSEMPASWPLEALKAQVITSRSYMYSLMKERANEHFDLEASVFDQVYSMVNEAVTNRQFRESVTRALRETRDQVLMSPEGEILRAHYHSDCGGRTEEADQVWGSGKRWGTVRDPQCPLSPSGLWTFPISRKNLGEKLKRALNREGELLRMTIEERSPSGRVGRLLLAFTDGEAPITGQELRRILGFAKLKSTNFQLQWVADGLVVHGRGNGHGVGMCQWGAKNLATQGKNFREILLHYYPTAHLALISPPLAL